jgi:hypothetical protein
MTNHFNSPFEMFFNPLFSHSGITLIYPCKRNTRKLLVHPFKHEWNGFPVLQVSTMHFHPYNQSERIGHDMTLSPIHFLPAVKATLPPF